MVAAKKQVRDTTPRVPYLMSTKYIGLGRNF